MRESCIVMNTTPILAIIAGIGDLNVLGKLYREVIVPFEVAQEIGYGQKKFGVAEFSDAKFITRNSAPMTYSTVLENMLDPGEASVIQTAIERGITTVGIDETAGRRVARLHGLRVTGSLGILLKAKTMGFIPFIKPVIENIVRHGIWITPKLQNEVLRLTGE